MKLRIEDAIYLHNRLKSIKEDTPIRSSNREINPGFMSKGNLAGLIWPHTSKVNQHAYMTDLVNGTKNAKAEWVLIIGLACGVDPNFLFGLPSRYDIEFEKLSGKQAELQKDYSIKYIKL